MSSEVPPFDPANPGPQFQYTRVADHIAARIAAGQLKAGARLEPEREIAETYGVAYLTVRRAMEVLRERGLIITVHGRGTFVAEPEQPEDDDE